MRVEISRILLEQIMTLAAADGREVCGLLLGSDDRIEAIAPAANVAVDPARHFELDPAVLIAAHRAARSGGPRIIGHYHSHPSGITAPSATDAACAAPDGNLWLIVGAGEAALWRAGPGTGVNVHFTKIHLDSE
ncbi:M67 family metallopeptidase [Sphingobium sp. Z007]|uniref:M67 family metallopeptidase n=1 Tax=Sphingobium sp. Z007 TaxID=627495 RepID=UPI000B496FC9|nr:M67 family metallopeptidase [Sphingobium sp. Z007]